MAHQRLLVYFVCTFISVSAHVTKYALKGQEINLVPSIFGQPDRILWMRDGRKVVLFDGMEEYVFPPYENRITLDWASAELAIKDAAYEDSGDYELEVNLYKQVQRSKYKWEVIDKIAKPSISCEMADANRATLVCATDSEHPRLVEFKWRSHGNRQPGPNLTITIRDERDDRIYRCDVSNPLTNESATFTAKDCFTDKKSALLAIILPIIFAVILILLITLACVFRRKLRGTACFENTKKGFFKRPRSTTQGSSEGDETTYFLGGLPTLPSNQRLRPLLPSDWIELTNGNDEKLDAVNGTNKELTGDEGAESDAAIGLTASADLPNSPLASSDANITTEHKDNSSQRVSGDTPDEISSEVDLPEVEKASATSTEEEGPEEGGVAAAAGQEPLSDIAQTAPGTGGENHWERSSSASECETESDDEDEEVIADDEQSENESHHSLTDRRTNATQTHGS